METPPSTSTPTDPTPPQTQPQPSPAPSTDPPPQSPAPPPPAAAASSAPDPLTVATPSTEPPPPSSAPPQNPNPNSLQPQEPTQQQLPQQPQPQSQPQQPPPPQPQPQPQQRTPAIPRPRAPTQSTPRAGTSSGGMAIGVPAGFSHHQRPQSSPPFSLSFRPTGSFGGSSPSFGQSFGGLSRASSSGPDVGSSSNVPGRPPFPGVQTIGMIGSLSTVPAASQLRSSGIPGQSQQRLGQAQVRSAIALPNQPLNAPKFPSHIGQRAPSMTNPSSPSPATPSSQPWMSAQGKQTHAASPSPSYRPEMKLSTMQQRPQHPQQQQQQQPQQGSMTSRHLQVTASPQQQKQQQPQQMQQQQQQISLPQSQEHHLHRNQQSISLQNQPARGLAPATPNSNIQTLTQPSFAVNDADEFSNEIISRKRLRELVTQVDRSEKLRPEIEDNLLEIADDFIESIVTAACHLAKHRKSTTLEAKDILLHVERHWNMTLPGFGGDEIKMYKKASTNDIHRERLAVIKKSMVGTNDGNNTKTPSAAVGQAAANPKPHASKTAPPGSPKARE